MSASAPRPPWIGRVLLRLARLGKRRGEVESDLLELYRARLELRGRGYAGRRFLSDANSLLLNDWRRPGPIRRDAGRHPWRWDEMLRDIRFALRLLRREAGVVSMTVLGLALAIGVNTVAFSLVNAMSLRPIGVPEPASIVRVLQTTPNSVNTSWTYREFLQLRDRVHLIRPEAWLPEGATFSDAGSTVESLQVRFVSGTFFQTFQGAAAAGRLLTSADDVRGGMPVAVISHAFWKVRLGGDPSVVGRVVSLSGAAVTIVGVAERTFTGPFALDQAPAVWLPLANVNAIYDYLDPFAPVSRVSVSVVGRLQSGSSLMAAQSEAASASPTGVRLELVSAVSPSRLAMSASIMAIVGLVLLLACANVTNLLIAGTTLRRQEIAARLALGATRSRIVRQLVTESSMLGLLAGVVGLAIAIVTLPATCRLLQVPAGIEISPDWRVYGFSVVVSLVAGIVAGLAPSRHGVRGDLLTSLKMSGGHGAKSAHPARLRSALVGLQAAVSVVLLVFAALFSRAAMQGVSLDFGFNPAHFASVGFSLPADAPATRLQDLLARAEVRVRTLPQVQRTGLAAFPPFSSAWDPTWLRRDGRRITVLQNRTSASYFETLGVTVSSGRLYTNGEVAQQAPVAVISERAARDMWGSENPIGSTLERAGRTSRPGLLNLADVHIVGVVSDVVASRLSEGQAGTIYLPLQPGDVPELVVRTAADAASSATLIREAVSSLDPDARVKFRLASDNLTRELDGPRILATLTGTLGLLALGLAVVGMFGITAFVVSQRLGEVSIRMALGASGQDILRLLIGDSLRPVFVGLGAGLFTVLAGGQLVASALYGISPRDPWAMMTALAVLIAATTGAVLIPARRAVRVDPACVLRQI